MTNKLAISKYEYDRLVDGQCDRSAAGIVIDAIKAKGLPTSLYDIAEHLGVAWEELRDQWRAYEIYGQSSSVIEYVQVISGPDYVMGHVRDELIKLRKELVDQIYEVEQ